MALGKGMVTGVGSLDLILEDTMVALRCKFPCGTPCVHGVWIVLLVLFTLRCAAEFGMLKPRGSRAEESRNKHTRWFAVDSSAYKCRSRYFSHGPGI